MRSMRRRDFLIAATGALTLAGCTSGQPTRSPAASAAGTTSSTATPAPPVFHVQPGVQPNAADQPCQLHQTDAPTTAYRGGPDSVANLELLFLAYYTANGNKRYCDGKPPTATDKQWARLYVDLTGNSAAVNQILSG